MATRESSRELRGTEGTRAAGGSHSPTRPPAHSLTRSLAHPLTRSRRPRLKLDELEPRIAPSALLYNVPFPGAISDVLRAIEDSRPQYLGYEDIAPTEAARDSADAVLGPDSAFDFSPVVPSEFPQTDASPSQSHRGHRDTGGWSEVIQGSDSETSRVDADDVVFALVTEDEPGFQDRPFTFQFEAWDSKASLSPEQALDDGYPSATSLPSLGADRRVSPLAGRGDVSMPLADGSQVAWLPGASESPQASETPSPPTPVKSPGHVLAQSLSDTTGPRVTAMTPAPGSLVPPVPGEIVIAFDEPVDASTVNETTVVVERSGGDGTFGDGNEIRVPGQLTVSPDGSTITYDLGPMALRRIGAFSGSPYDVQVVGNLAYVADRIGLKIVDVSDPTRPRIVGGYDTPGAAESVSVAGAYAYVADAGHLRVIDVSNPTAPAEVGSYYTPGWAKDVSVVGGHAYVAADGGGLRVIDVRDPGSPVEVGFYDTPRPALGVSVVGGYAYVADEYAGLRLIDVTNPSAPWEVGFWDTPGEASDVSVAGGYAYVVDSRGLRVIDVREPSAPAEVGFYDTPVTAWAVTVAGGYAYVVDSRGLRVIDVREPSAPAEVGFYDTPDGGRGMSVAGGHAYVADTLGGLRVMDVSNPTAPVEVGFYDTPEAARGVSVVGGYAYVADGEEGLRVIDVGNPSAPSDVGFRQTPEWLEALSVSVVAGYAYVASGGEGGLRVIDVSNPTAPVEVGYYDTPGEAKDVSVVDGYAYVADDESGLRVIDVRNPNAPVEVGFYDTPGWAVGVSVVGGYAYVAGNDDGLRVIDVSNPAAPVELGFFYMPVEPSGVSVAGGYAYLACGEAGLRIIDVSNPSAPAEVAFYDRPGGVSRVSVAGRYAYVNEPPNSGLWVIDVTNPPAPVEVGFYDTPGEASDVSVVGGYAYVADGEGGLLILDASLGDTYRVTVSEMITDGAGNRLDGEGNYALPLPVGAFPSGDGVPGGNFVATFAVGPDTTGPRVTAMTPNPGATIDSVASVQVAFDEHLDGASVSVPTFRLSSDNGADDLWGTSDDMYVGGTVAYDAGTRQATFTPLGALAYGQYAVWLDASPGGITDLAGNRLDGEYDAAFPSGNGAPGGDFLATFSLASPEVRQLSPTSRRMSFLDADGDTVTVLFGGSAGTATITRTAAPGQRGNIETIAFADTDQRSTLTLTVRELKGTERDGTTVQSISGSGIGTLNMNNVDLAGNTITLDGLKKLVVDDILDGSHIMLGGSATDALSLTANRVGNVNLEFPGVLKSATVTRWTGGRVAVGRLDSLTVKDGTLGVDIEAAGVVGSVMVKGGSLTGDILVQNATGQTRTPALGSVKVEGGNITGSITVENGGNAGSILAKAVRGVGGAIGDEAGDAITVAGRLASVTSNGDIRAAITVENQSGATKGNALNLVKAVGGSLFGPVEVLNSGNLGTLQAKHIEANVTVDGKAAQVRSELDNVVAPGPPPQFLATITLGGKGKVRGKNATIAIGDGGGQVWVQA